MNASGRVTSSVDDLPDLLKLVAASSKISTPLELPKALISDLANKAHRTLSAGAQSSSAQDLDHYFGGTASCLPGPVRSSPEKAKETSILASTVSSCAQDLGYSPRGEASRGRGAQDLGHNLSGEASYLLGLVTNFPEKPNGTSNLASTLSASPQDLGYSHGGEASRGGGAQSSSAQDFGHNLSGEASCLLQESELTASVEERMDLLLSWTKIRFESFEWMKTKVESLESSIGDICDKHAKESVAALADRILRLEILFEESADELKTFRAEHLDSEKTVKTCIENLEVLIARNSDEHSKDLEVALQNLGDWAKYELRGLEERQEKRMNSLEKSLAEWASMLKTYEMAHGDYLKPFATLIGDVAKHAKDIEDAKEKLRDLGKEIDDCSKHDQLASVAYSLEQSVAASADKLKTYQAAHGEYEDSMKIRLESLEALIAHNSYEHAKDVEVVAKESLGMWTNLGHWAKENGHHFKSVEERLNSLDKLLAETDDNLKITSEIAGRKARQKKIDCSERLHLSIDNKRVETRSSRQLFSPCDASPPARNSVNLEPSEEIERAEGARALMAIRDTRQRLGFGELSPSQAFSVLSQDLQGENDSKTLTGDLAGNLAGTRAGNLAGNVFGNLVGSLAHPETQSSDSKTLPGEVLTAINESSLSDLKSIVGETPTAIVESQSSDSSSVSSGRDSDFSDPENSGSAVGCTNEAELQLAPAISMNDLDSSEWLPPHEILSNNSQILGSWSYEGGAFRIHSGQYGTVATEPSRLYFSQFDFTGELEAMVGWLQVYVPQSKGSIRMQIDSTGNHLRAQFKKKDETCWRKSVLAHRV